MPSFQFKRKERLKSRKILARLFDRRVARSFGVFPLRLIWLPIIPPGEGYPVLFAVSVPKRAFPRAHQRNRIRRQIREAYRLHKHCLYEALSSGGEQYAFMLLYTAREPLPYERIEAAVVKIIGRFLKQRS